MTSVFDRLSPARRAGQVELLGHALADFLSAMMVLQFLLVLLDLAIKLVRQNIDRSVKILRSRKSFSN